MTADREAELLREVERLHEFILNLSPRLFAAAECLARVTERKHEIPKS